MCSWCDCGGVHVLHCVVLVVVCTWCCSRGAVCVVLFSWCCACGDVLVVLWLLVVCLWCCVCVVIAVISSIVQYKKVKNIDNLVIIMDNNMVFFTQIIYWYVLNVCRPLNLYGDKYFENSYLVSLLSVGPSTCKYLLKYQWHTYAHVYSTHVLYSQ